MVKHIVLFKFREEISPEKVGEIDRAFRELPSSIPEISRLEGGDNNSPEKLNKGFTRGYILTFPTEEARNTYLPHTRHKAFSAMVKEFIDDVLVFDYTVD